MKTNDIKEIGGSASPETEVAYAIVLRTTIERIPAIKKSLKRLANTRVIYQRVSARHLLIVEDTEVEVVP